MSTYYLIPWYSTNFLKSYVRNLQSLDQFHHHLINNLSKTNSNYQYTKGTVGNWKFYETNIYKQFLNKHETGFKPTRGKGEMKLDIDKCQLHSRSLHNIAASVHFVLILSTALGVIYDGKYLYLSDAIVYTFIVS